jgi:hypothetical protein
VQLVAAAGHKISLKLRTAHFPEEFQGGGQGFGAYDVKVGDLAAGRRHGKWG